MRSSNYLLRYTVFLFAAVRLRTTHRRAPVARQHADRMKQVTYLARGDDVYHPVCLLLVCSSIVRHWCAHVTPAVAWTDRIIAHACYALSAHTHLVERPNAAGACCLAVVLALWICEHRMQDWALAHAPLHITAAIGLVLAIRARGGYGSI
jgi:hypothetical protein